MLLKSFFYPKIKRNINNNNEEIQLLEIKIIPIDENTNNNISPSNINQPIKSPYHDNQKEYSFEICDTV